MKKTNRIPFIILAIIHTTLLIYAFYKNKDRKGLFALLMSIIGFAYLFEYIVFTLFQAYRYKPNFFKNKHLDSTFGAILSQAIYIPFTAVFITAFQFGWKVKLFFVAYFYTIEKLFVKLGVYKLNWWKSVYTMPFLPIYFTISDFWYKHLKRGTPSVLSVSLFQMLIVVKANSFYLLAVFRKLRFGLGSFHSWREHFILTTLYTIICSFITTYSLKKQNWSTTIKASSFLLIMDWLLKALGFIKLNFPLGYLNMGFYLFIHVIASQYKNLLGSIAKK